VAGEKSSAYRLLAMEGLGLAGAIGGVAVLGLVGGNESSLPSTCRWP